MHPLFHKDAESSDGISPRRFYTCSWYFQSARASQIYEASCSLRELYQIYIASCSLRELYQIYVASRSLRELYQIYVASRSLRELYQIYVASRSLHRLYRSMQHLAACAGFTDLCSILQPAQILLL